MRWPDWIKYRHSPLIYAFDYGDWNPDKCEFTGGRGFLWPYHEQALYVVLPQYPPLAVVK